MFSVTHAHPWLHQLLEWMRMIQQAGPLGWALFIGLYAFCCLLFLPASFLTVAAGAVYGFWGGTVLVLAGNGLGSVGSLLITRTFLRDWATRQLKNRPRLEAIERAVAHNDWKLVILTRLSPIMPFSLINYALGLTPISAWRFLLATELGSLPATGLYVYLGTLAGRLARVLPELKQSGPRAWLLQGAGLVGTLLVTVYITRLANNAVKTRLASEQR